MAQGLGLPARTQSPQSEKDEKGHQENRNKQQDEHEQSVQRTGLPLQFLVLALHFAVLTNHFQNVQIGIPVIGHHHAFAEHGIKHTEVFALLGNPLGHGILVFVQQPALVLGTSSTRCIHLQRRNVQLLEIGLVILVDLVHRRMQTFFGLLIVFVGDIEEAQSLIYGNDHILIAVIAERIQSLFGQKYGQSAVITVGRIIPPHELGIEVIVPSGTLFAQNFTVVCVDED